MDDSELDFFFEPTEFDAYEDEDDALPGIEEEEQEAGVELPDQEAVIVNTTSELTAAIARLTELTQENRLILNEVGVELLSQSVVLTKLHKQTAQFNEQIGQIDKQIKGLPNPATILKEPIEQIQESQKVLIKSRRDRSLDNRSSNPNYSHKTIALLLAAQTGVVAIATTLALNYFPPKATAKAEQQWYSIFQRVDKLYKAKFGNKPLKK